MPQFSSSRKNVLCRTDTFFLSSLHEFVTTTANPFYLSALAQQLYLPEDITQLEGSLNSLRAPELVTDALAYIFTIPQLIHEPGAARKVIPASCLDKDGLLVRLPSNSRLTKDGLIHGNQFIPYCYWLSTKPSIRSLSGGLIDSLLRLRNNLTTDELLGFRLHDDIVIDVELYRELEHRAHSWGPTGLTEAKLINLNFPEIPDGTITEHRRFEQDLFRSSLFRGLSHVEIMWSRKDNLKSVQIEELVLPDSPIFQDSNTITVAYLHSIWNDSIRKFIHLDGAAKTYSREEYQVRYHSTMNKIDSKASVYRKVFRLDKPMLVNEWADLATKFFYLDELVIEYLSKLLSDNMISIIPKSKAP